MAVSGQLSPATATRRVSGVGGVARVGRGRAGTGGAGAVGAVPGGGSFDPVGSTVAGNDGSSMLGRVPPSVLSIGAGGVVLGSRCSPGWDPSRTVTSRVHRTAADASTRRLRRGHGCDRGTTACRPRLAHG